MADKIKDKVKVEAKDPKEKDAKVEEPKAPEKKDKDAKADEPKTKEPLELLKEAKDLVQDLQTANEKLTADAKKKDAAIETLQKHINEGKESEVVDDNTRTRATKIAHAMVEKGVITPVTKDAVAQKLTKTAGLMDCVETLLPRVKASYGETVVTKNASQQDDADNRYFKSLGVS